MCVKRKVIKKKLFPTVKCISKFYIGVLKLRQLQMYVFPRILSFNWNDPDVLSLSCLRKRFGEYNISDETVSADFIQFSGQYTKFGNIKLEQKIDKY